MLGGVALATLVAIGIGLHNLGEGLAIGSSFALGELALGSFLIVGFMVHNVTEGLGIAAPIAEGTRVSLARLAGLAAIAGAPAIVGAWIGGFLTSDLLGVLFFAVATGAALQVVVEVGRYVARRAPGGLRSGWVGGGFLAGIAVMYLTGLLVASRLCWDDAAVPRSPREGGTGRAGRAPSPDAGRPGSGTRSRSSPRR